MTVLGLESSQVSRHFTSIFVTMSSVGVRNTSVVADSMSLTVMVWLLLGSTGRYLMYTTPALTQIAQRAWNAMSFSNASVLGRSSTGKFIGNGSTKVLTALKLVASAVRSV